MKKLISFLIIIALLTGTAYAALYAEPVNYPVMVNGEAMTFTDAEPLNFNGRTMLPVRAAAEALGVNIEWVNNRVEINTIDLEALKDACVMLHAGKDGKYLTRSSGVLIDYDEVLTCYHCVDEGDNLFQIFYDDSAEGKTCTLNDYSTTEDAAVLVPTDKTVKPVKVGDSDEVQVGDKVYIISSPKGIKNTVTSGTVVGSGYLDNSGMFVFTTTVDTNSGSSGGACFNAQGELIGIVEGESLDGAVSNIIPINDIRESLAA